MSIVAYSPPGKSGASCSGRGPSVLRYVSAVLFLAFGIFLAVKAIRTSDVLTGIISVGIIAYAVMRAYGKAG